MSDFTDHLTGDHVAMIACQSAFFVATAADVGAGRAAVATGD